MLPDTPHLKLVKKERERHFLKSLFALFCFKTVRCSNPPFIVRVVWDWPRKNSPLTAMEKDMELCQRGLQKLMGQFLC